MRNKRIAILGAGPVGIEAALAARELRNDVLVLERDRVGGNVERWGHVRLFSPFALNHSERGARLLAAQGHALPQPGEYLTGADYLERYPVAAIAGDLGAETQRRDDLDPRPLVARLLQHLQELREELGVSTPPTATRPQSLRERSGCGQTSQFVRIPYGIDRGAAIVRGIEQERARQRFPRCPKTGTETKIVIRICRRETRGSWLHARQVATDATRRDGAYRISKRRRKVNADQSQSSSVRGSVTGPCVLMR